MEDLIVKKKKEHYVDNKLFTQAVHEYVLTCRDADEAGMDHPRIPEYIGGCFWKIAKGMTLTRKFVGRNYKDDLVMDAVEDCLKRITNYNIEAATRSGNPNAFGYFNRIIYFSFLRTVQKHNRTLEKELKYTQRELLRLGPDDSVGDVGIVLKYIDEIRDPWKDVTPNGPREKKT